uniref:Uncharacterized protein n=1 Tax=Coccolithus braarudii TaxID=221442 RepID=A0A7S0L573_9EUKA|mmetsp:Transcript_21168/g.45419  ORF Transcript_21168/g.45419 Transcript_21168/m.45419 type:complete len:128 (+) Transcript_21168:255-638(+)
MSSLGSLWKQLDNATFEVPAGPQLAAFLFAIGPAVVTRYNLIGHKEAYFPPALVSRKSASSVQQQWAHDAADVSMLTERGKAALAINPALRGLRMAVGLLTPRRQQGCPPELPPAVWWHWCTCLSLM